MAERTLAVRKQESEKCHQLIEHHVQDFQLWIKRTQSSNFPSMVVELRGRDGDYSGHERPFARLGPAELAREDGREGFRMRIFAHIAVAAAFVRCRAIGRSIVLVARARNRGPNPPGFAILFGALALPWFLPSV